MDTRIKERLVGAIALVAIVVIVVPELLTGQRPAPVAPVAPGAVPNRTVVIDLTTPERAAIAPPPAATTAAAAGPPPAATATPAPEPRLLPEPAPADVGASTAAPPPDVPASAAVAHGAPPAPSSAKSAAAQRPPATLDATPSAAPAPPRPNAAAHGGESWVVQLGSFSSHDNAEHFAASLRTKGYKAFVSEFRGSGKVLFRVRVGPEQDRARADAIAARLAREGHKGSVTPEG